mmetsp:Transcript_55689/g.153179  ORF Transcript_55689/g.153179 Transcript_55689/m.153179 type:complete len:283 (-) Transcript_55689:86-934(-)
MPPLYRDSDAACASWPILYAIDGVWMYANATSGCALASCAMIASAASETRTCASESRYVYMPTVVGRPAARTASTIHAPNSGVSTIRSAPAALLSSSLVASAARSAPSGSTSVPAEARAAAISSAQLAGFLRATAITVAPHSRSVCSGPSADVAPRTTKQRPLRSSQPALVAAPAMAASAAGSRQPYAVHAASCVVSASPLSVPPSYGTSSAVSFAPPPRTVPLNSLRSGAGAAIASASLEVLPSRTNSNVSYMHSRPARAALIAASGLLTLASSSSVTHLP